MLKRINIEDPKEELKEESLKEETSKEASKVPTWLTNFIQKLKDNKKIVIGVAIGILLLGKAFSSLVISIVKILSKNLNCILRK